MNPQNEINEFNIGEFDVEAKLWQKVQPKVSNKFDKLLREC